MKWLSIGAWLVLTCLPVAATVSHLQKDAPRKRSQSQSAHRSSLVTNRVSTSGRSGRAHANLRTASYSPGDGAQSSTSSTSTRASSKKKSRKKKIASKREPSQMSPTPERISEIQTALERGGYYKADPTGKWDSDTVDAVQRFQSANRLDTTGKLDALTLQKLGLGSDVAGVSAPKGIVSHSCCSMSPSPSYAPPTSGTPTTSFTAASPATRPYGGASGSGSTAPPTNDSH